MAKAHLAEHDTGDGGIVAETACDSVYHRLVEQPITISPSSSPAGPAPGINSVIGAATIRARLEEINVVGLRDGFEWIMRGDIDHVIH